jgi:tetratricopeptide (TPR) repeat protein
MSANARFQSVTERLVSMTANGFQAESDDIISCCGELEQLARDFLDTARTYGRVIISEMHLPIEYKTIRPLKLGGVLGGQKYVVRGILFKIPDGSMFSKYPDPMHIANKVQGHELKGLKAYFGWFFNRGNVGLVSFPLIALIDYKGHRITAMTQLPIQGKSSLIYGSADAGQDCIVANEIPAWSQFIREASLGLNLKPHFVVNGRSNGGECEMVSCVDLEGHKGSDQRFYLLDFSRTFPPVFKAEENRRQFDQLWPFYHMFRPEFVATWSLPLCADACSNFQSVITGARKEEATRNNKEIRSATEHLMTQTMAHVCKSLLSAVDKSISLTHVFHRKGLNMRYLGLVYSHLVSDALYSKTRHNLYRLVQAEALMRVLKNHLRTRLRSVQEDSVVLREAVMGLNFFFGFSSNAAKWVERNPFVLERLVQDFYFSEGHAKGAIDTFLSDATVHEVSAAGQQSGNSIKYVVLTRLNAAIGLGIRNDVLLELQKGSKRSFARSVIFEDADLSFQESVKHLDVVERARGLAQFLKASRAKDSSSAEKLLVAFETVEKALEASPLDSWLSLLMGDICNALWNVLMRENVLRESKLSENEKQDPRFVKALADELVVANLFCDRANVYYNQAIAGDQPLSYRNYGMFCLARKLTNEAEDAFLKALEACSRHGKPLDEVSLIELVSLLVHKGNGALANSLREKTKSWCHFRDTWLNVSSATDLSASTSFRMGGGRSNTLTSTSPPTLPARPRREALQSSQPAVVVKRAVRQVRSFGNMLKRRSPKGPQEKLERRASGEFDSSFDSDRESGIESGIATDEEGKEHEELRSSLQQNLALLLQQSGTDDDEQEEGLPHSPRPIELSVTQSLERNKLLMTKLGK